MDVSPLEPDQFAYPQTRIQHQRGRIPKRLRSHLQVVLLIRIAQDEGALLLALTGSGLTRLPLQRHTTICELTFPTSILAVKLNRKRLIVVLEEQIYVYDISNMKLLHTLLTSPNPNGKLKTATLLRATLLQWLWYRG